MTSLKVEIEIADILKDMQSKQENILEEIKEIKIGQVKLEGRVESLDKRLSGQIETLDKKLSGQIEALDEKLSGRIETLDKKLSGRIDSLDERLSGQIETLDEKLSGQIKTLDTKVEQIDKRVAYQEFINRGVLIGLILALLGGAAKIFGFGVN
ncbi:MAG: hypothetical protein AAGA80_28470, partial [Cyanobacteria bacterium P01_F01_bin.143]